MVSNITSFTGNGLKDWLWQRVTAVILAVYAIFLFSFLFLHSNLDYSQWSDLFRGLAFKLFTFAALFSYLVHAWIGLWTVSTDYLKCAYIRVFFQITLILFLMGVLVWGINIIWSV